MIDNCNSSLFGSLIKTLLNWSRGPAGALKAIFGRYWGASSFVWKLHGAPVVMLDGYKGAKSFAWEIQYPGGARCRVWAMQVCRTVQGAPQHTYDRFWGVLRIILTSPEAPHIMLQGCPKLRCTVAPPCLVVQWCPKLSMRGAGALQAMVDWSKGALSYVRGA